jgi:hypothetical protein
MARAFRVTAAAIGAAVLVLSQSIQPAAARCDPGRAPLAQHTFYGAQMGANPGVIFNAFEATVDNNDVPYIEGGGHTYSWMIMQNASEPHQFFGVALRYSAGQGKLSSTAVYIQYTDESGAVIMDTFRTLGTIGGTDTAPRIKMSMIAADPFQRSERFQVWVNGEEIHDNVWLHGAEGFTLTRAYVHKDNRGSQVIGENASRHKISSAVYTTQHGLGTWGPQSNIDSGAEGNIARGSGFVHTWDANCN